MANKFKNSKVINTLFLFVLFAACKKTNKQSCFIIKYVDGYCYTHIYQIITPSFQHLGQANWTRPRDSVQFNNVFVLQNHCEDLSTTFNSNDSSITVRLLNDNETINRQCITCQAAYNNPPLKSLAIKSCNYEE